jgi:hypothetical protein
MHIYELLNIHHNEQNTYTNYSTNTYTMGPPRGMDSLPTPGTALSGAVQFRTISNMTAHTSPSLLEPLAKVDAVEPRDEIGRKRLKICIIISYHSFFTRKRNVQKRYR